MELLKNTFNKPEEWNVQSKRLKERYPELTDTDLVLEPGQEEALVTRLESRLNKKREEIIFLIKKSKRG